MNKIVLGLCLLTMSISVAQKKSLTHNDYDLWKRVGATQISDNARIITTSVTTATNAGDAYLEIHDLKTGSKKHFVNGSSATISPDEKYVFFVQKPAYKQLRQEKKDKVKKDKGSKNTFKVYEVATAQIIDSIPRVQSFYTSDKVPGYVIVKHHKDLKPEAPKNETKKQRKKRLKLEKRRRKNKTKPSYLKEDYLIVYYPQSKHKDTITHIKDFVPAREGKHFIYSRKKGKDQPDYGVYLYDVVSQSTRNIHTGAWQYDQLTIDKNGKQMAYYAAIDSAATDSIRYQLHYVKESSASPLIINDLHRINSGWQMTQKKGPQFSENAKRLFFYTQPSLQYTIDSTLLEDEIAQVDIWHYQDRMTQPEQQLRVNQLKNKSTTHFLNTTNNQVTDLDDYHMNGTYWDSDKESDYFIFRENKDYDIARSWQYPWRSDYYVHQVATDKKTLLIKNAGSSPIIHPNTTQAIYFNHDTGHWHAVHLKTQQQYQLTADLGVAFNDLEDDHPSLAPAYGFGGFDQQGHALLYDKYDVWSIDLAPDSKAVKLTDGRKQKITYRTYRLDRDHPTAATYIDGNLLLNRFDTTTKDRSIVSLSQSSNTDNHNIVSLKGYDHYAFAKAKNTNTLLYKSANFSTYPDVHVWNDGNTQQITHANRQQNDYKWGSVELFSWTAYDGTNLEGLLYKPENFDPKKKYPLIVYFYEKYTDRLHSYRSPLPSASTVNFSYLVSNDYVVFVPNILYKDGHPGESAYNCIVSGTQAVADLGFIDTKAMALQGQSWGGYQTAYLVTRTNMYAAAMAGAPVSNMTSAYGGIRWGSGLSRAFQYERTQSRLGKNLWDGLDLYLENSPLFHIPKIHTPLLMMHNDDDGAVPYYQGIEMFMGMRRLGKPAWLLVYNNEAHNLRKMKNKRDLSIRMMQFFDHYLKGKPAASWMINGLPAHKKGKQMAYELEDNTPIKD